MDGKKAWFFHGDVFDVTMQYSKWLTRLGGIGYDFLILLNSFINFVLFKFGRNKLSLSKTIKNSVKGAVKYINRFEKTAVEIAIANGFSYVVCGHIHHPQIKKIGDKTYHNLGDWVDSCSAMVEDFNGNLELIFWDEKKIQSLEKQTFKKVSVA